MKIKMNFYVHIVFICILRLVCSYQFFDFDDTINENCTCVPFYQCSDETGEVITDGQDLLDVRSLTNTTCMGYFDVCCHETKNLRSVTEEPVLLTGCGYQYKGKAPWIVSLLSKEIDQFPAAYVCSASLIHPKVALTAAHCVNADGLYFIKYADGQKKVSKTIIHPQYDEVTLYNDIALVILEEAIVTSDLVNTICIPSRGTSLEDSICMAPKLIKSAESASTEMVKLPIVPAETCLDQLRSTRLGPYFVLHPSFICAGGNKDEDTCAGDGGAPLVCPVPKQPGRYHQVGIVSWGIGCGENQIPGVYVNLRVFRHWIDKQMQEMGLETTSYRY